MRIAGLLAAAALVAACSHPVPGRPESVAESSAPPPPHTGRTTTTSAPSAAPAPGGAAPAAGASIEEVVRFVEAAAPADAGTYGVAFRDGVTTRLDGGLAFTAPSGEPHGATQCLTTADGLTCLVELTSPPPSPGGEGVWKPGWIDFPGTEVRIGALRGDPGPFVNGAGAELPAGRSLAFGDDRCRSDPAGLFCVNYAHRSGVLVSAAGVVPFGCLQPAPPAAGIGAALRC